jgi:hypothetical protein
MPCHALRPHRWLADELAGQRGEAVAEGSVPTAKVLQTERLQIVDANGQVRIELSAQPRGTASRGKVFFYDKDGNKRSLSGKGIVRDAEGNVIGTADSTGVNLMSGFPSKALLEIRDQSGKVVWSAPPETKVMFVH